MTRKIYQRKIKMEKDDGEEEKGVREGKEKKQED